jgi:hypothetical protein
MQAQTGEHQFLSVVHSAGGGAGSGAVQDDAMGRKVLKVDHHAVSQLPHGTLNGSNY